MKRGASDKTRLWRLWWLFFGYTALVSLLVQFVLLPYVFSRWHAGGGLLLGSDSVWHHAQAVHIAQRIQAHGWSVWRLRPGGQAPAGIASAIYVLTTPQPWTLIPLNAALHATAAVVLLLIIELFVADRRVALWSALPFLLFPSAAFWYTQLLKDGWLICGALLLIYGWALLARRETWSSDWRPPVQAAEYVLLGALLAWIVRPYSVQIMQYIASVVGVGVAATFLARRRGARMSWERIAMAFVLMITLVALLTPLTRGISVETPASKAPYAFWQLQKSGAWWQRRWTAADQRPFAWLRVGGPPPAVMWESSPWLPGFADSALHGLAIAREDLRYGYQSAGRRIDADIGFRRPSDVIAYLPRATTVAFLAPWPAQWLERGADEPNWAMRLVSAGEMAFVYVALVFLPFAIWRWRRRVELWVVLAFCVGMMVVTAEAITNMSSLYRMRYGYLMVLVGLGVGQFVLAWREATRAPGGP